MLEIDEKAAETWLYPLNKPLRDYQYNIVKKCLFNNTLVCLPTGLGKTFIAAVVLFNFYRWFPNGKLLFLAPTRPLVSQQIEACFNLVGIPREDIGELTGTTSPELRLEQLKKKRCLFMTPQVLVNDLKKHSFLASSIVCK